VAWNGTLTGMAYLSVNGMRSHRYPLAGCGSCDQSPLGRVTRAVRQSLGLDVESAAFGGSVVAAGLGGVAIGGLAGWWLGRTFGRVGLAANRRRRAR